MAMCNTKFQDEKSQILFVLSSMKGGTAGPRATQKINAILSNDESAPKTFNTFAVELDVMFADPVRVPKDQEQWAACMGILREG